VSALEPGLYRATVRGVADQIVMLTNAETDDPWVSLLAHSTEVRWRRHEHRHISDARPLIVLDLENPAAVVRSLREATRNGADLPYLDQVAASIEAQTRLPRIPAPGLWGVVKASCVFNAARVNYLHDDTAPGEAVWSSIFGRVPWSQLIDPILIRDGIEP